MERIHALSGIPPARQILMTRDGRQLHDDRDVLALFKIYVQQSNVDHCSSAATSTTPATSITMSNAGVSTSLSSNTIVVVFDRALLQVQSLSSASLHESCLSSSHEDSGLCLNESVVVGKRLSFLIICYM